MAATGNGHKVTQFLKSACISILILSPSLATGKYAVDNQLPVQPASTISYLILGLASINLGTVIMLDLYRRHISKFSPAAIIGLIALVLLFIIVEALRPSFTFLDYNLLTPFVVACQALIYTTVFIEKNIVLKCLHSLNSIAVFFLWALGAADKFMMPF